MFDEIELEREFFEQLTRIDQAIVARVAAQRCRQCGGPLHRGDYPRKPRGGLLGAAAEAFERRFSLCCGREGCRRRATPPSVRFLGRRVYVGAVIIVVSVVAATAERVRQATGVSPRTARRWCSWWREAFPKTDVFIALAARLIGVERRQLPLSILERLRGHHEARVGALLWWLAPLTTSSIDDGARFLRGVD